MSVTRDRGFWGWALLLAIGLTAPLYVYPVFAMNVLAMALFASAFNLLLGYAGLLSFGHAVYYGLGAFIAMHALRAINAGAVHFPITLMPLVGGAAGLVFGVVFGYVTTRRAVCPPRTRTPLPPRPRGCCGRRSRGGRRSSHASTSSPAERA